MPSEQTPIPQPESFNFLETNPKKNFAPWFLKFCGVLITVGLATAGYFKYPSYRNLIADIDAVSNIQELFIERKLLRQDIILPPDPGEAGKKTLEGIDSDSNGVRDDVQRWIEIKYIDSPKSTRETLRHLAAASQRIYTASDDATRRAVLEAELAAVRCLTSIRDTTFSHETVSALSEQINNTPARMTAHDIFGRSLKSAWFDTSPLSELGQFCNFATNTLDTSSWQTYRNEEYGFEFRYPDSFYISPTRNAGPLETFIGDDTVIYLFIDSQISPSKSMEELTFGKYHFRKGDYFFEIKITENKMLSFQFDSLDTAAPSFIHQILSTFKFIESSVSIENIRIIVEKAVLKDTYRDREDLLKIKLLSANIEGGTVTLNFNRDFFYYPDWTSGEGIPWDITVGFIIKDLNSVFKQIKTQTNSEDLILELQENGIERDGMLI